MTWRLCTRYLCTNINIHEWARTRSSQHSSINLSSPAKANDTIANLWELKWRAGDGKIFRYIHPQDTFCIHKYQDTWQIPCSFELRYTVGCDTSSKRSQARERFGRLRRHWKAQWDEKLMKCRWGRKDISSGNGNGGRQSAAVCVRKLERWKIENTKKN